MCGNSGSLQIQRLVRVLPSRSNVFQYGKSIGSRSNKFFHKTNQATVRRFEVWRHCGCCDFVILTLLHNIQDFKEHNDDTSVHFGIIMSEENMNLARQEGLYKKLKLTTTTSTSNMHLFDPKGFIKTYDTPEQILEDFFHLRLEYYEKRKKTLVDDLELDPLKLDNKVWFILGVVGGEIIVNNQKPAELFLELQQKGFNPFPKKGKGAEIAVAGATEEAGDSEERPEVVAQGVRATDYEYLVSLSIGTLTLEKVQQLCAEKEKLDFDVAELRKASPRSLWIKDIDAFEIVYDKHEKRAEEVRNEVKVKGRTTTTTAKAAPKKPRKINFNKANAEPSTGLDGAQAAKPKAGQKKAAAKKPVVIESDEDEEILELKYRLAEQNIDDSSLDQTVVKCQSIVIYINLFFTAAIAQCFLALLCHLRYGVFILFAGLVVNMSLFIIFLLPETKQVPIEEMSHL